MTNILLLYDLVIPRLTKWWSAAADCLGTISGRDVSVAVVDSVSFQVVTAHRKRVMLGWFQKAPLPDHEKLYM
jgi:hypothetical protein